MHITVKIQRRLRKTKKEIVYYTGSVNIGGVKTFVNILPSKTDKGEWLSLVSVFNAKTRTYHDPIARREDGEVVEFEAEFVAFKGEEEVVINFHPKNEVRYEVYLEKVADKKPLLRVVK